MGYRKSLERVTEAKVKFVTKTLNALYADNEEQKTLDDIAANILKYESNMKECDKALVADYTQTLDDYKTKDDLATVEETYNKRFKDDEDSLTNKHLEWNAAIADWQKRALGEDGKPGELEEHLNKITKYNCKGEEIEGWQETAMEKLKINFDLCVQRMESRKTCYLEQVRAQRRCAFTRLTNRLTEMKRRTQEQFTKFADAAELNKDWDQEVEAESKKEDININITKLLEAAEEKVKKAFNKWWD